MNENVEKGISIVIPCLNEKETIVQAVTKAKYTIESSGLPGEVIVVDNDSNDGSSELAAGRGARVIQVKERGYGAALQGGILSALYSYVVTVDADLAHPFEEIQKLINPLQEGKADLVLGSRLKGKITPGAMPFLHRYVGTPVLSFLIRALYSLPVSDCNSGMRALLKSCRSKLILPCPGMEYSSAMLIRASRMGLRYCEVPINIQNTRQRRRSHLRCWRDGWRHIRLILSSWFQQR